MRIDVWSTQREKAEDLGLMKVYRSESRRGKPTAILFKPKATNPFANYCFRNVDHREQYIAKMLKGLEDTKAQKEQRKADRQGTQEQIDSVKVGDIFHFSWGYEQTNVDFFQVIDKKGKRVILREIAAQATEKTTGNGMADFCIPVKDHFTGGPITKLLQFSQGQPYLKMASYGWCGLWDGKECYRSWYA